MELREAIELIHPADGWEPDDFIPDNSPMEVGGVEEAISIILNAVADGTLIPADQCFEVKEGYDVTSLQTYNKENDRWDYPVPLSEALQIRSADDVRREALQQAANEVEAATEAARQRFNAQGDDYDNGYGNAGLDLSEGIRALIDTPQPKGDDDG